MSKRELQRHIRNNEGLSVSSDTLNLNHLLASAYDLIVTWDLKGNPLRYIQKKSFRREILECFTLPEGTKTVYPLWNEVFYDKAEIPREKEREAFTVWDEVYNYFNSIAPPGYYFGSTEGDGSDIGFWKIENIEEAI